MLTDIEIDELIQPIINLYNQIELDLIVEIAKRFDTYDKIGGSLEWQIKKLNELSDLNQDVIKLIAKYSKKSEAEIIKILKAAGYSNLDTDFLNEAYSNGIIGVDPAKLFESPAIASTIELSYKELSNTYRLIQTKAIESCRQEYMNILNTSYLDVASGTYDYQTSIKKAIGQMVAKGIEGATYKRGNTYVRYSIEGTVRRDTLTAVHQLANKVAMQSCEEMSAEYVEISHHLGARVHPTNPIANHAGWQGKVFKINGSEKGYPNLKASTGYPDDILGLGGVNCRHRMFPFFPGISVPNPIKYNEAENARIYKLTQKQRKLERDIRNLKKKQAAAEAIGDEETAALMKNKLLVKYDEINEFCERYGLKRDYSRELVSEQVIKTEYTINNSDESIEFQQFSFADRNQYAKIKNILGDKAPATLEKFAEIKYTDSVQFNDLRIAVNNVRLQKRIKEKYNLTIEEGKQGKHIKGHNNYKQGKSYLNISMEDAQMLVNEYAGTGIIQRDAKGKWKRTEIIILNENNIGYAISILDGKEHPTSAFKIHYSKRGTHIVPTIK